MEFQGLVDFHMDYDNNPYEIGSRSAKGRDESGVATTHRHDVPNHCRPRRFITGPAGLKQHLDEIIRLTKCICTLRHTKVNF